MSKGRGRNKNMQPKQTGRNVGDIYRPVAKVEKLKNGVESVLIIRGIRYVMEHPNQFKGFSLKPTTLHSDSKRINKRSKRKKDKTHQQAYKTP